MEEDDDRNDRIQVCLEMEHLDTLLFLCRRAALQGGGN